MPNKTEFRIVWPFFKVDSGLIVKYIQASVKYIQARASVKYIQARASVKYIQASERKHSK